MGWRWADTTSGTGGSQLRSVWLPRRQHRSSGTWNIRNEEAERLAAMLAKLTGETKTEAVTKALRDRLARVRRQRSARRLADALDEIAMHCARLPLHDTRTADEIIGYDERGAALMVLATSALLAILQDEAERRAFNEAIEAADTRVMSVATFVELSIVLEARHGVEAVHDLDLFLERAAIELAPVDLEQARIARRAFARFGKGRHKAGLNFGDCFAYALAAVLGEPLLCKGDDFRHTDLACVSLER